MPRFNSSKLRSAISKYNNAVRKHNQNVRRAVDAHNRAVDAHNRAVRRHNAYVRDLHRQLSNLRMTVRVRTSVEIRREVQVATTYREEGVLVREAEWNALGYDERHELRAQAEQQSMELIVVDDNGDELYRP